MASEFLASHVVSVTGDDCRLLQAHFNILLQSFEMATVVRESSRFAGVKTFSEKFSQPEVDAEGRIRKVGIAPTTLLSCKTVNVSCAITLVVQEFRGISGRQIEIGNFQELAHICA